MSYRSSPHDPRRERYPQGWAYEYPQGHSPQAAPAPVKQAPQRPAPPGRKGRNPSDYTLVHAGRQVRLGPVAFWIVVGALVIMAG
jgi:hypothetical protein